MGGNTFGRIFRITTFGESHGKAVGVVVDGCPAGIGLSESDIQKELDRRKPGQSAVTTQRKEADEVQILSGVFEGKTTGTPIAMVVFSKGADSSKYEKIKDVFRPGHADVTYFLKYGFRDYRGGGRSSGRETIGRVAAGAIAKKIIESRGVRIIGHVKQVGRVVARGFSEQAIEKNDVRCADPNAAKEMERAIMDAKGKGDSLGGVVEVIARNVPAGLGEPVFDKLDAEIAKALMSIPAVKGVEIGAGFAAAGMRGSEMNDEIYFDKKIKFRTNNAGGILGGISNGADIVARVAVKPTSSIAIGQKTIDERGKPRSVKVEGMHDPCICPRIVPVAEAMLAVVLADFLLMQSAARL